MSSAPQHERGPLSGPTGRRGTDLFDMVRIKAELEEVLGAPVDLIPRDGLKERVRSAAAKDLLPL